MPRPAEDIAPVEFLSETLTSPHYVPCPVRLAHRKPIPTLHIGLRIKKRPRLEVKVGYFWLCYSIMSVYEYCIG